MDDDVKAEAERDAPRRQARRSGDRPMRKAPDVHTTIVIDIDSGKPMIQVSIPETDTTNGLTAMIGPVPAALKIEDLPAEALRELHDYVQEQWLEVNGERALQWMLTMAQQADSFTVVMEDETDGQ